MVIVDQLILFCKKGTKKAKRLFYNCRLKPGILIFYGIKLFCLLKEVKMYNYSFINVKKISPPFLETYFLSTVFHGKTGKK